MFKMSWRCCFYLPSWKPTPNEWTFCNRCIQSEEKERIRKFVYKKDAIASMVGRLMLRKLISEILNINYGEVGFERSAKERPILRKDLLVKYPLLDFNLSHQGDYCVCAAEINNKVGIDVMKISYTGGKSISEFFNLMRRQFTSKEWDFIELPGLEMEKLGRFYRLWCLKESYVKAIGVGISYSLQQLSFCCKSPNLQMDIVTTDTELYINNERETSWTFQETLLDKQHCVAVAINKSQKDEDFIPNFKLLTYQDLIENAEPLSEQDTLCGEEFYRKPE
ncbi:L-aminoadipate-semialdehyde dehydrogenase-phosphopantetheinyl transferase-like [Centruroides sculpturatus]|uniref:L-aminoadipate-semialdehyde dehydrogenase-phosphopantetheinyl transferase-like n=1 Tax=Centruroides sculpturatus TaxID=218467 RepID=UPI000C6E2A3D|nr:L-aminoadipate-semialdehyde dehydrogenase-phosphopantetheinyl transferase-like [Centruroides sculpturatus]XP_023215706.1 L-aminoadipate-semialdehyde dehydrogenase-phosphopantetheinyl transferase-like [Centruroides sculpturatus]